MSDSIEVSDLRDVLEEKSLARQDVVNAITIDDGPNGRTVYVTPEQKSAIEGLSKDMGEIQSLIEAKSFDAEAWFDSLSSESKDMWGEGSAAMAAAAQAAAGAGSSWGQKSLGQAFVESDEFKSLVRSGRLTMDTPFEIEVEDISRKGTYGQKDIWNTGAGSSHTITHGFGRVQFDPMVPRGQRPTRIRDLFPVATTNANLIDYFRVLGFTENGGNGAAAPVAERTGTAPSDVFGVKPKSNLQFQPAQAPVRTIAHWEAAHRNVLADEPQLQSTINNELLYGLALEEDDQLVNGDGTGENLLGILNQPNTQSYTQTGAVGAPTELKSDALRRAATLAILANYPPTGYVLNPLDWEDIELQKGGDLGSGDGQYMLFTNISIGADQRVWRQPVVESPAMPEGTFVTGAWGTGAQLYDRQVANVRIAEQHADFFVRNAVAILVEERLAFAVKRPESFVIGEFLADA